MRVPDQESGRQGSGMSLGQQSEGQSWSKAESDGLHLTALGTSATGRFQCGLGTLVGPLSRSKSKEVQAQVGSESVGPESLGAEAYGYKRHLCKAYGCPRCRGPKLRQVRNRIAQIATEKKLTRLATLTLDPSRIPVEIPSHVYLRDCWRKMRVYLARHVGRSIAFISVLELQQSGRAHLHVLVDTYIEQAWLSQSWQAVGGGKIVDIRFVDLHRVVGYLAKYLTKDSFKGLPAGTRIFSTSKGIVIWEKKKSALGWWLSIVGIDDLYAMGATPVNERHTELDEGCGEVLVWFEDELIEIAALCRLRPRSRTSSPASEGV